MFNLLIHLLSYFVQPESIMLILGQARTSIPIISISDLTGGWLILVIYFPILLSTLQWHIIGRDGVSNHQPYDCLLKRLFRRKSKKTSKLRFTGICAKIDRWPVNSPHKWPGTRKAENVSIWWRHHENTWRMERSKFRSNNHDLSGGDKFTVPSFNVYAFRIARVLCLVWIMQTVGALLYVFVFYHQSTLSMFCTFSLAQTIHVYRLLHYWLFSVYTDRTGSLYSPGQVISMMACSRVFVVLMYMTRFYCPQGWVDERLRFQYSSREIETPWGVCKPENGVWFLHTI